MRVGCIVNPTAGWGRGAAIGRLLDSVLAQLGIEHRMFATERPGQAADLARELLGQGWDCLAVVGGDGTFSQVAAVAAGGPVPVALVPAGTGNAMARALGVDGSRRGLEAVFRHPVRREIDTAAINGRPFFALAGIGFDAQLVRSLRRSPLLPRTAGYIATGLLQLGKLRPFALHLEGAGAPYEHGRALCLAVCNGPFYGAGLPVAPAAELSDGRLDFCLLDDVPVPELPLVGAALLRGRHASRADVHAWQGTALRVETDPPAPWHADGEPGGLTPAAIELRPVRLSLLVPPGSRLDRT